MAGQNREQGGLWTKQRKERGGSDPPGEWRGGAMRQGVWRKIMETQLSPRCKINNIIKAHWDGLRGSHISRGGWGQLLRGSFKSWFLCLLLGTKLAANTYIKDNSFMHDTPHWSLICLSNYLTLVASFYPAFDHSVPR